MPRTGALSQADPLAGSHSKAKKGSHLQKTLAPAERGFEQTQLAAHAPSPHPEVRAGLALPSRVHTPEQPPETAGESASHLHNITTTGRLFQRIRAGPPLPGVVPSLQQRGKKVLLVDSF